MGFNEVMVVKILTKHETKCLMAFIISTIGSWCVMLDIDIKVNNIKKLRS